MPVGELQVERRKVSDLRAYARNSRTHPAKQIDQLVSAIREFGFTNPILVAEDGEIVAGHGRLEAARKLGLESVPTICLRGLTAEQRRALVIADNRIGENSGWDKNLLALELADLQGASFDVKMLGFSERELGEYLQPKAGEGLTHPDDAPALADAPVSMVGDVWVLGAHRVVCGDSTAVDSYSRVLGAGATADVCWTDPPYNVAYGGKAEMLQKYDKWHCNTSRILNDDMSDADFARFLGAMYARVFEHLNDGAAIYVAHAETEGVNFRVQLASAGFKVAACLVWRKDALVLGRSDYQWIHEPILYGWKPGGSHRWFGGRKQTSFVELDDDGPFTQRPDGTWQVSVGDRVFIVEGAARVQELVPSVVSEPRPRRNDLHPTMKPVALIERMLRNSARPGDVVLEPFGGSGSTLIAAERLQMKARVIELEPRYVDVIVRRWQDYTGGSGVRESDGARYNDAREKAAAEQRPAA